MNVPIARKGNLDWTRRSAGVEVTFDRDDNVGCTGYAAIARNKDGSYSWEALYNDRFGQAYKTSGTLAKGQSRGIGKLRAERWLRERFAVAREIHKLTLRARNVSMPAAIVKYAPATVAERSFLDVVFLFFSRWVLSGVLQEGGAS